MEPLTSVPAMPKALRGRGRYFSPSPEFHLFGALDAEVGERFDVAVGLVGEDAEQHPELDRCGLRQRLRVLGVVPEEYPWRPSS